MQMIIEKILTKEKAAEMKGEAVIPNGYTTIAEGVS